MTRKRNFAYWILVQLFKGPADHVGVSDHLLEIEYSRVHSFSGDRGM